MIALEIMGPVNDVVVPTMLKKEKKRNSFPRGVTSEICFFFPLSNKSKDRDEMRENKEKTCYWERGVGRGRAERMGANHDLTITVVWGDGETPPDLKQPEFPRVMVANPLAPDAYHSPDIEDNDTRRHSNPHGLGADIVLALKVPTSIDTEKLPTPSYHVHVV